MLVRQSTIGRFSMTQLLGNRKARLPSKRESAAPPDAKIHKKDFHGRRLYLTATPHPVNPGYAAKDKRYDEDKVIFDV
jgi:hypothetical protein